MVYVSLSRHLDKYFCNKHQPTFIHITLNNGFQKETIKINGFRISVSALQYSNRLGHPHANTHTQPPHKTIKFNIEGHVSTGIDCISSKAGEKHISRCTSQIPIIRRKAICPYMCRTKLN